MTSNNFQAIKNQQNVSYQKESRQSNHSIFSSLNEKELLIYNQQRYKQSILTQKQKQLKSFSPLKKNNPYYTDPNDLINHNNKKDKNQNQRNQKNQKNQQKTQKNIKNQNQCMRSNQQFQLILKLIRDNKIFYQLGFLTAGTNQQKFQEIIKDISKHIILIFSQKPSISEIKPNQIYLILQGKTFQYVHNQSPAIKLKIHENNDYLMIRKLIQNDYFISFPQYIDKNSNNNIKMYSQLNESHKQKYQLMIDQNTLMGKISTQIYEKYFLAKIYQRIKQLTNFMKMVSLFQNLPLKVFFQLSKFFKSKKINQNQEIIKIGQKSKQIYFIKRGFVQYKIYKEINKSNSGINTINTNEKYSNKVAEKSILREYDIFGMDTLSTANLSKSQIEINYSALSLSECQFYYIDKRILAIVISSFEKELRLNQNLIKSINMNSQIKGQNYLSQRQQMLSRNVLRIKTSQKKIRDYKLRSYSKNKKKQINTMIPEKDRAEINKNSQKDKIQNKFRSSAGFRLSPSKLTRSKSCNYRQTKLNMLETMSRHGSFQTLLIQNQNSSQNRVNNYQLTALQEESSLVVNKTSLTTYNSVNIQKKAKVFDSLRKTSQSGFKFQIQNDQKLNFNRILQMNKTTNSFIPKMQKKGANIDIGYQVYNNNLNGKLQSQIIRSYIDRKLKNQIVKKTQQVLEKRNQNQRISIKNIKKYYESISSQPKNKNKQKQIIINKYLNKNQKQITDQLFQRMNNIKQYPLLCKIQTQRKKLEQIATKAKQKSLKKLQKTNENKKKTSNILIKNIQIQQTEPLKNSSPDKQLALRKD